MYRLSEIKVPTLVLAGRDDFLFSPKSQAELAVAIPEAQLQIIERAGHEAPSEQPDKIIRVIQNFIAAITPNRASKFMWNRSNQPSQPSLIPWEALTMNTKKLLPGSLAAAVLLALSGKSNAKHRLDKSVRSCASCEAIDSYIEREMRRLNIPGVSLAIVEGDEIVHARGFGRAHPHGEAPSPQTPFFIGSLTKSFTALAIMQLIEAGKVELDAPIQRYLPWFRVADPHASAQMTVRHLLNQTSGLPESVGDIDLANFDSHPDATERQARSLASLRLTRPVGAACEYSNINYNVLGLVVEAASGETYANYILEHILAPLGLSHTFNSTSRAAARENGLAMGYQYWFGIPFAAPNLPIPHGSLPSGWLISTAEDMARYLIAHLNEGRCGDARILSAEGINELHRGAVEVVKMGVSAGKYAMGWFDGEIGQTKIVWHSGTSPDFGAYMALLPEQRKGVILLFNACHWWYNPAQTEFGMGVAALLAGEAYQPTPYFAIVPWILRGQLLIPAFQIADVAVTLGLLLLWRLEPERRPKGGSKWGLHILLSLIPNLLIALTLRPILGKRRGYLNLFMPDFSWLAKICGSFAVVWSLLRIGLILRALQGSSAPKSIVKQSRSRRRG